ncbi:MAG: amidase family protein, partial [Polynucleobacter victoriensis]
KTTNPHNPAYTPGGSSSGSAAAVADDMIPLATGSQTAGSVIRPAAFCGVVGYKPTYGKVSLGGVKSLSPSLDTLGSFTRTVSDAALCVAAMSGDTQLATINKIKKKPRIAT